LKVLAGHAACAPAKMAAMARKTAENLAIVKICGLKAELLGFENEEESDGLLSFVWLMK
jgi:hypothetical protein